MKLDAEMIMAQGFQIILGQDAVLRGPDGRTYWPHHRVMVGVSYYPAGEIRNILAEDIENGLRAEIQADKRRQRDQMAAGRDRKPARRPPRRRGKRAGSAGDRLGLVGKEFVTPIKKF